MSTQGDDAREPGDGTTPYGPVDRALGQRVTRGFELTVVEGPAQGRRVECSEERCSVGSFKSCDLVIDDATVSRFHCEVINDGTHIRVVDLGSRNGTFVDGTRIERAFLRSGSLIRLGRTTLGFQRLDRALPMQLSSRTKFGSLVGSSVAMRATFALLEKVARSDVKVLLEGETGTGKSAAARSIHGESMRKKGPFVQVDCGAIPANLLESELFGHIKGAFTGAVTHRVGAFEAADDGTLFLDEIGELPLELQPKLLLALELSQIQRLGEDKSRARTVDVRIITATNRDLRAEVNNGRFREDLYYRIAVANIRLPPLRQRPDDLPELVRTILRRQNRSPEEIAKLLTEQFLARLVSGAWPGNIRELTNYVERCLTFETELPIEHVKDESNAPSVHVDATLSWAEAKGHALRQVEHFYINELLRLHGGQVSRAARTAGIDRTTFYKKMRRYGIKPGS